MIENVQNKQNSDPDSADTQASVGAKIGDSVTINGQQFTIRDQADLQEYNEMTTAYQKEAANAQEGDPLAINGTESTTADDQTGDFSWLTKSRIEHIQAYEKYYGALGRAALSGQVELATQLDELPSDPEALEGDVLQAEQLQQKILEMADRLEEIKSYQADKKMVEHRRFWSRETLKDILESGTLNVELDLTATKDGGFFISHDDKSWDKSDKEPGLRKKISESTSEEMKREGKRMSLEEIMEVYKPYQKLGHRLILELKDFGQYGDENPPAIDNLKKILEKNQVTQSVSVASLSPGLLMKVHAAMPDMPLILNTGVFPFITAQEQPDGKKLNPIISRILTGLAKGFAVASRMPKKLENKDTDWWTVGVKLPWAKTKSHIIVGGPEGVADYFNNAGDLNKAGRHQFAMTDIPGDIVEVLREQRAKDQEYAGVSMAGQTIVDYWAKKFPFLKEWSAKTTAYYYDYLGNQLGVNAQIQVPGKHTIGVRSKTAEKKITKQENYLRNDVERLGETVAYVGHATAIAEKALQRQREAKKPAA